MDARSEILARIAAANVPPHPIPQSWPEEEPSSREEIVAAFVHRAAEYRAEVVRVSSDGLASEVRRRLSGRIVVPPDLDPALYDGAAAASDYGLSSVELDRFDGVMTMAAVGVAETGTLVLDHGPEQGRRAITLVPDRHIVLLASERIVASVPEAVALLAPSIQAGRPLTWISGPSATSDIELQRVEGVHGPRRLEIVVYG